MPLFRKPTGGGAPTDASYVTTAAEGGLSAEKVLGSDVVMTGTYAALPAAGTAGRIYVPNNSFYSTLRDNGSSWDHFVMGRKVTPPVDSDFAWVNQENTTLVTTGGGVVLVVAGTTNGYINARVKTAPSVPYTLTACLIMQLYPQTYQHIGLCWRSTGDSKMTTAGISKDSNMDTYSLWRWLGSTHNSATSWNSNLFTLRPQGSAVSGAYVWMQLVDDNTNRIIRVSTNGQDFVQLYSVGRTNWHTPNQIGFYGVGVTSNPTVEKNVLTVLGWETS